MLRLLVLGGLLLILASCGWNTADQVNGKNPNSPSSTFTNNTTVTTISGSVTTVDRQAGSFASSTSVAGTAPFTTTTSNGTFITDALLIVPTDTNVTFETVTDPSASPTTQLQLLAEGKTVTVASVVSWIPGLIAGQRISLSSGQSINVPSGTTISTLDGGSVTVNGHHNAVSTSAGAIVAAPITASNPADNRVTAL